MNLINNYRDHELKLPIQIVGIFAA